MKRFSIGFIIGAALASILHTHRFAYPVIEKCSERAEGKLTIKTCRIGYKVKK